MRKLHVFLAGLLVILLFSCVPEVEKKSSKAKIPSNYQLNNEFWDNASVYFVITDRFYNGNPENDESYGREKSGLNATSGGFYGGDIAGLTAKLDYLEGLGIDAIWITAPYEQIHGWIVGSGDKFEHYPYHGYYALDFTQMDANMGTVEEFRTFVDTAHEKGIRVLLDVVMNHPGYASVHDLKNLVPEVLKKDDISGVTLTNYHNTYINYDSPHWSKWWGPNWIRAGFPGHSTGSGDLLGSQASLPDFKTESSKKVGLPSFFARKLKHPDYPRTNYEVTKCTKKADFRVRDYLIHWLSSWVREFGIDGFRCDTAKHVEKEAWYELKVACIKALRDWKKANPTKAIPDSGDFWTVGEVFPHGVTKDDYFTKGAFNALINFDMKNKINSALTDVKKIDSYYANIAPKLNSDAEFNMLSYISSHDTSLFYSTQAIHNKAKQKTAGSLLAMSPGAIQIYYGDEVGRKVHSAENGGDAQQGTRSQMPWAESGYNSDSLGYSFDTDIHDHWQKMLNFRKAHPVVGAGDHEQLATEPYTFKRTKSGMGSVVVVLGASGTVEVDVTDIWADGTTLTNSYDGTTAEVVSGKVSFDAGANGVILISE